MYKGRPYRSTIRPFAGDPSRTVEIEWYFADWTAPVLPPHAFHSTKYEPTLPDALGEDARGHTPFGGQPPFFLRGGACEPADWWLNGAPADAPLPALDPNTGAPTCCIGSRELVDQGGSVDGGTTGISGPAAAVQAGAELGIDWATVYTPGSGKTPACLSISWAITWSGSAHVSAGLETGISVSAHERHLVDVSAGLETGISVSAHERHLVDVSAGLETGVSMAATYTPGTSLSVVRLSPGTQQSSANPWLDTWSIPPSAGHTIVYAVNRYHSPHSRPTLSDNQGNTYIELDYYNNSVDGASGCSLYYLSLPSTPFGPYVVSAIFSGNSWGDMQAVEVNQSLTNATDTFATGTSTLITPGPFTVSHAPELAVMVFNEGTANLSSATDPAGYATLFFDGNYTARTAGGAFYRVIPVNGTDSPVTLISNAGTWVTLAGYWWA